MIGQFAYASQQCRDKIWAKSCPPLYQETVMEKLPAISQKVVQQYCDWDPDAGKGLVFTGASRLGKSRAIWLIIKPLILEQGLSLRYFDGIAWPMAVSAAFGDPANTATWMDEVCRAQLLFIDDAFKQRLTDAQELAYYGILERRAAAKLPLILTFNATGAQIRARMTSAGEQDRFVPIMERIREFNDCISFK